MAAAAELPMGDLLDLEGSMEGAELQETAALQQQIARLNAQVARLEVQRAQEATEAKEMLKTALSLVSSRAGRVSTDEAVLFERQLRLQAQSLTLTAGDGATLLAELKRFKVALGEAGITLRSKWLKLARSVASGRAAMELEHYLVSTFGSEERYQRALAQPEHEGWPELWDNFESRLQVSAGLDAATSMRRAIGAYERVRLAGDSVKDVEAFIDAYTKARTAMLEEGLLSNVDASLVKKELAELSVRLQGTALQAYVSDLALSETPTRVDHTDPKLAQGSVLGILRRYCSGRRPVEALEGGDGEAGSSEGVMTLSRRDAGRLRDLLAKGANSIQVLEAIPEDAAAEEYSADEICEGCAEQKMCRIHTDSTGHRWHFCEKCWEEEESYRCSGTCEGCEEMKMCREHVDGEGVMSLWCKACYESYEDLDDSDADDDGGDDDKHDDPICAWCGERCREDELVDGAGLDFSGYLHGECNIFRSEFEHRHFGERKVVHTQRCDQCDGTSYWVAAEEGDSVQYCHKCWEAHEHPLADPEEEDDEDDEDAWDSCHECGGWHPETGATCPNAVARSQGLDVEAVRASEKRCGHREPHSAWVCGGAGHFNTHHLATPGATNVFFGVLRA